MTDPDPAKVTSREEFAECLHQLHVRADYPSLRQLEDRTKHANGLLSGTQLNRVRLGRSTLSEVLRGSKFPTKAFLLTLVEALHVDPDTAGRWEQAWNRLADQGRDQAAEMESERLQQELAEAKARADHADKEAKQLRQQLAATEELIRQQTAADAGTPAPGGLLQAITTRAFPVSLSFEEAIDGLTVTLPEITVEIPPAITDRREFFYAFAEIRPHPVFGRDGENLTVTVPLARRELEQGADIKVPAFRRAPITMRIPPRTPAGRKFRIAGHGVGGPSNETGYLIITVSEANNADEADQERAELCSRARSEAVTINPVGASLPRPGIESKGVIKRKVPTRDLETPADQARTQTSDLRTAQVIRLIAQAEETAQSITDDSQKAHALAAMAKAAAAADPTRAERLITEAERIAQSITDDSQKAHALAAVARAAAAADPFRAGRIAQSITDDSQKALTLAGIAEVVAAIDPFRARRLIDQADDTAQSIADDTQKALALAAVARAVAAADPDYARRLITEAERIAQSITDDTQKARVLAVAATAVAAADPARFVRLIEGAERAAQLIIDDSRKARALAGIAEALAATHPTHAERIAESITDDIQKARALVGIVNAVTVTYPGKAEPIAQSITDDSQKAYALALIAKAVAVINPDYARQLITMAEAIALLITDDSQKARALVGIAEAVAATDPYDAERVAQRIVDPYSKTLTLTGIAEVAAATDSVRVP